MRIHISGIYSIKNIVTGDLYIGQSKSMRNRWHFHRRDLNRNKHRNPRIAVLVQKHGPKSFVFTLLEECRWKMLNRRERHWIDKLKPSLNIGGHLTKGRPNHKNRVHWARRRALRCGIEKLVK